MFLLAVMSMALCLAAPGPETPYFETGAVKAATSPDERNCYPVIARTERGNLFTVWTRVTARGAKPIIVGAFSQDGGKTWSEPATLIDTPGMGDYDPNIVVDDNRILVYSTTTPIPQPVIDR